MTDVTEPIAQADSAETTPKAPTPEAATPKAAVPPKKLILLSDYLAEIPAKLRLATYNTIVTAVKRREVPGIVHPSDKGEMEVVDGNNKTVTRPYPHVVLKNTAELLAQLDALCIAAVNSELIRSHGRSMNVVEMLEMEDELDFDTIAAAVNQEINRPKTTPGQKKPSAQTKPKKATT